MSILIDPYDPRGPKAVALATQALAAGWPSMRAFYVPSRSDTTRVYVTTRRVCTCPAFTWAERRGVTEGDFGATRRCYHALAIELMDQVAYERAAF